MRWTTIVETAIGRWWLPGDERGLHQVASHRTRYQEVEKGADQAEAQRIEDRERQPLGLDEVVQRRKESNVPTTVRRIAPIIHGHKTSNSPSRARSSRSIQSKPASKAAARPRARMLARDRRSMATVW